MPIQLVLKHRYELLNNQISSQTSRSLEAAFSTLPKAKLLQMASKDKTFYFGFNDCFV